MQLSFEQPQEKEPDNATLAQVYARVFSAKDGKMILEDVAKVSGMYRTNFVQGNSDYTSFLEGQRALLLYICSRLNEEQPKNIEGRQKL